MLMLGACTIALFRPVQAVKGATPPEVVNYRLAVAYVERTQADILELENAAVKAFVGKRVSDGGVDRVMTEEDIRTNLLTNAKNELSVNRAALIAARDQFASKKITARELAETTYDRVRSTAYWHWRAAMRFAGSDSLGLLPFQTKSLGWLSVMRTAQRQRYWDMQDWWRRLNAPREKLSSDAVRREFDVRKQREADSADRENFEAIAAEVRQMRDKLKATRKWIVVNLYHWQKICDATTPDREPNSFATFVSAQFDNERATRRSGLDPGHSATCMAFGDPTFKSVVTVPRDVGSPFKGEYKDVRVPDNLDSVGDVWFTLAGAISEPAAQYARLASAGYDPMTMSPAADAREVCENLRARLMRFHQLASELEQMQSGDDARLARLDAYAKAVPAMDAAGQAWRAFVEFVVARLEASNGPTIEQAKTALANAEQAWSMAQSTYEDHRRDVAVVCPTITDTPIVKFRADMDGAARGKATTIQDRVDYFNRMAQTNSGYPDVAKKYADKARGISDLATQLLQPFRDAVAAAKGKTDEAAATLDAVVKKSKSRDSAKDRETALSLWQDASTSCAGLGSGEILAAFTKLDRDSWLTALDGRPSATVGEDVIAGPHAGELLSYGLRARIAIESQTNDLRSHQEAERASLAESIADRETIAKAAADAMYDVMNLRLIAIDRAEELLKIAEPGPKANEYLLALGEQRKKIEGFLKPPSLSPKGDNRSMTELLVVSGVSKGYGDSIKRLLTDQAIGKLKKVAGYLKKVEEVDAFVNAWQSEDPAAMGRAFGLATDLLPALPVIGPVAGKAIGYYGSSFADCVEKAKTVQESILGSSLAVATNDARDSPETRFYTEAEVRDLLKDLKASESFVKRTTAAFQIRRLMFLCGQAAP